MGVRSLFICATNILSHAFWYLVSKTSLKVAAVEFMEKTEAQLAGPTASLAGDAASVMSSGGKLEGCDGH